MRAAVLAKNIFLEKADFLGTLTSQEKRELWEQASRMLASDDPMVQAMADVWVTTYDFEEFKRRLFE